MKRFGVLYIAAVILRHLGRSRKFNKDRKWYSSILLVRAVSSTADNMELALISLDL